LRVAVPEAASSALPPKRSNSASKMAAKFAIRKICTVQRMAIDSGGLFFNSNIFPLKVEVLLQIIEIRNILYGYILPCRLGTCIMIQSGTLQCVQLQIENNFCRMQLNNCFFIPAQIQKYMLFSLKLFLSRSDIESE